jgi:hypothetical protein
MYSRHQNSFFYLGLLGLLVSVCGSTATLSRSRGAFTPFVPIQRPTQAIGDFDGDGRPDVARIRDRRADAAEISVQLSGSSEATLHTPVTALVDGDVDHDGDLDLLATTVSGDVVVWINDGHGRFTRRLPSETHTLTAEPVAGAAQAHAVVAITTAPPPCSARTHARASVVVTKIRPPTAPLIVARHLLLLHALRAPPFLV